MVIENYGFGGPTPTPTCLALKGLDWAARRVQASKHAVLEWFVA